MYSVIIDNKLEQASNQNYIKFNFGKLYLILLILGIGTIYFYSVYKNNYLSIFIPYRVLWYICVIFIGISILEAKNKISLIIGWFITILSVVITISSIFVYSSNINSNVYDNTVPILDAKMISSYINLVSTKATIKSENTNAFKVGFTSNYDMISFSNYKDENRVNNIDLIQNSFPPGIGSYNKNEEIVFPNNTPISFKINSNLSMIEADLSELIVNDGSIKTNNSIVDIVIKDINLANDIVLDINSNFSIFNIVISKEIPVILSNSSSFSQTNFIGLSKDLNNSNTYISNFMKDNSSNNLSQSEDINQESKKLIINLTSTLSQVKVSQK
jgi:hypothetical protein